MLASGKACFRRLRTDYVAHPTVIGPVPGPYRASMEPRGNIHPADAATALDEAMALVRLQAERRQARAIAQVLGGVQRRGLRLSGPYS
jgi:hypothetical protein